MNWGPIVFKDLSATLVAFLEPLRGVQRVVSQCKVGAGALDGDQGFQNGVALVEVAGRGGCLERGVLTGYLVRRNWERGAVSKRADDV